MEKQNFKIKMCVKCGERPVHIKKRGLCSNCYGVFRKDRGGYFISQDQGPKSRPTEAKDTRKREVNFIKNYFDHNNWIYQPAMFRFNGVKYSPDFYDGVRNVFIEVAGTRQAYHQAKEKYDMFREHYPKIDFEIRKVDGSILNEENRDKNWNTPA